MKINNRNNNFCCYKTIAGPKGKDVKEGISSYVGLYDYNNGFS